MVEVKGIAKLNESLVNHRADGEIIHHSCNVVKKLMENRLDAGSSSISIILAATKRVKRPTLRIKTKEKKQTLPEKQTIKYYFKPIIAPIPAKEATREVKRPLRIRTKGKKQALTENQTIKHYFKPIVAPITAKEATRSMSHSGSSVIETPLQSVDINLQSCDNNGFNSKTTSLVYHKCNNTILRNIRILKQNINMKEDSRVSKLLQKYSDIGSIDQLVKLIKFKEKYYVIQTTIISKEYFCQRILSKFGSFGKLKLIPPLSVQECLSLVNPIEDVNALALELYSKKDFLSNNFKTDLIFENDNIYLKSLPLLGDNYMPTLERIPLFIFNISTKVDWECELECLGTIAHECALLNSCNTQSQWTIVQDGIMKGGFKAPKYLAAESFIAELNIPAGI